MVEGSPAVVVHHGKDNRLCKACNQMGHKVGSSMCPALPTEDIYAFKGFRHPLSNHYAFDLYIWDNHFKSVEHGLFWKMAKDMGEDDLASQIKLSKHAGVAKALSKSIASDEVRYAWEREAGIAVMTELLYVKCRQCPQFVHCIYENRDCTFAEATPSKIWASGMSEYVTMHTTPKNWIGENMLGQMMNDIADNIENIMTELSVNGGARRMFAEWGFEPVNCVSGESDGDGQPVKHSRQNGLLVPHSPFSRHPPIKRHSLPQ
jgi:ribA/ribD-fused uncharacterized protein